MKNATRVQHTPDMLVTTLKGARMPESKTSQRKGRPVIGDAVKIRLTSEVKAELESRADRYGMNLSEYVRTLIVADIRRDADK